MAETATFMNDQALVGAGLNDEVRRAGDAWPPDLRCLPWPAHAHTIAGCAAQLAPAPRMHVGPWQGAGRREEKGGGTTSAGREGPASERTRQRPSRRPSPRDGS
eukprot:353436-Chlamydomonas_euryale.AAC.15